MSTLRIYQPAPDYESNWEIPQIKLKFVELYYFLAQPESTISNCELQSVTYSNLLIYEYLVFSNKFDLLSSLDHQLNTTNQILLKYETCIFLDNTCYKWWTKLCTYSWHWHFHPCESVDPNWHGFMKTVQLMRKFWMH